MKTRKFLIILALIIPVFVYQLGCSKGEDTSGNSGAGKVVADQELRKFNIVQTTDGSKQWEMDAQEAQIYKETKSVDAKDLYVTFFEEGKKSSILTAQKGKLNTDSGDIEVEGNVVVNSLVQNTTIETEKLFYIAKDEKIVSNEFVKQTREDSIITGYGLETDPGLRKVQIKRDVKAEVIEKDNQEVK
ncbi:MAG: LPS export ABC transporter periplasmic protein LptC [bacterium]